MTLSRKRRWISSSSSSPSVRRVAITSTLGDSPSWPRRCATASVPRSVPASSGVTVSNSVPASTSTTTRAPAAFPSRLWQYFSSDDDAEEPRLIVATVAADDAAQRARVLQQPTPRCVDLNVHGLTLHAGLHGAAPRVAVNAYELNAVNPERLHTILQKACGCPKYCGPTLANSVRKDECSRCCSGGICI